MEEYLSNRHQKQGRWTTWKVRQQEYKLQIHKKSGANARHYMTYTSDGHDLETASCTMS